MPRTGRSVIGFLLFGWTMIADGNDTVIIVGPDNSGQSKEFAAIHEKFTRPDYLLALRLEGVTFQKHGMTAQWISRLCRTAKEQPHTTESWGVRLKRLRVSL